MKRDKRMNTGKIDREKERKKERKKENASQYSQIWNKINFFTISVPFVLFRSTSKKSFCQEKYSLKCCSVGQLFCTMQLLSCNFINLTFNKLAISSTFHLSKFLIPQLDISPAWRFINIMLHHISTSVIFLFHQLVNTSTAFN